MGNNGRLVATSVCRESKLCGFYVDFCGFYEDYQFEGKTFFFQLPFIMLP